MTNDLKKLFAEAMQGVPGAEDRFFEALTGRVLQFSQWHAHRKGILRSDHIDDISQEVLLRYVYRVRLRAEKLGEIANWDADISIVVFRCICNHFKVLKRHASVPLGDEHSEDDDGLSSVIEYVVWRIDEQVTDAVDERIAEVEVCMDVLRTDAETRMVVLMRLRGHSFLEISEAMGLTVNAVSIRYHRFCKTFRELISQRQGKVGV